MTHSLNIPPRLWRSRGVGLLGRVLLAEVERRSIDRRGCAATDEELAETLEVAVSHVTRTLTALRQARLVEVVLDADDRRLLRLTELAARYWQPPSVPLYEATQPHAEPALGARPAADRADVPCSRGVEDTPSGGGAWDCGPDGPTAHGGEGRATASRSTEGADRRRPDLLPVHRVTAGCPDHAFPNSEGEAHACHPTSEAPEGGSPSVSTHAREEISRRTWVATLTEGSAGRARPRDGPGGSVYGAIALTSDFDLPPDLFAALPPDVVMALYRGDPCIPMNAEKKPLVKWKQYQQRLPLPGELRNWLSHFGESIAGWARVTGRVSGVIVLDDDGEGWFDKWGLSPHVLTGGGGWHWIGRHPGWPVKTINARSSRQLGEAFPRLDIRADGGYSVICGYSAKGGYKWLRDPEPDPLDLLPRHVRRFFGLDTQPKPNAPRHTPPARLPDAGERVPVEVLVTKATRIASGYGRNNAGFWLACQLRDNAYTQAESDAAGSRYIQSAGHTDTRGKVEAYTAAEWETAVRQAFSQPARSPWPKGDR